MSTTANVFLYAAFAATVALAIAVSGCNQPGPSNGPPCEEFGEVLPFWMDEHDEPAQQSAPRFRIGPTQSDQEKDGTWSCARCRRPMVGDQIHTVWTSDGKPISFSCVRCWQDMSASEATRQCWSWIRQARDRGHKISDRSAAEQLQAVYAVRSFEVERARDPEVTARKMGATTEAVMLTPPRWIAAHEFECDDGQALISRLMQGG